MRFPTPLPVLEGGVAVFADAHLGQAERDADDFLEALHAVSARGFRTIVLLGDIFHYFIGDPKFESPLVARVLGEWEALKSAGVALRYVEGNRDFFVRGSRYSRPFAAYGTTDGLAVGGKKYAFVHGDRVNTDDLPYRFWRTASKNPVAAAAHKIIPGPLARAIVHRTEARLYNTNFKHKRVLPEEHLLLEGRRA
ncbi:MAG TPA: metallophosphoesterase, partial [Thermoanaerobaculia bacterium]|nr:metallophosphoesterase [Thermoanaerobaculia bacterium]